MKTPADIAAAIADGALLALPPDYSLVSMETVRALIRRKAKSLKLLGVPILGLSADLLIGAGCVAEVETSAVSLGEAGLAPRFTEAAEKGEIVVRDATCPAIHTALQAAEKGVPYMPLRGVIGSDLVAGRADWKIVDDLLIVPALRPDVALFHARWADEAGNVWVGRRRELATVAHAAKQAFVTFEELRKGLDAHHHVAAGYRAVPLLRWGDPVVAGAPAFDALGLEGHVNGLPIDMSEVPQ